LRASSNNRATSRASAIPLFARPLSPPGREHTGVSGHDS
jgi:hypothetical protein